MEIAELKNVCKTYPAFRLCDVSFSLERGRITGFIGRNGAGKTTTIKSMLNLIHTDSGEISYFGLPLQGHETEIKQRIGYSTGTVSWYPRKAIREIIEITRSFYPGWDEEACRRYMTLFGLEENKKPIELSEGMKVKFNLLLALSHRAEILILDEPTVGIDAESVDRLLHILHHLNIDKKVTILMVTHDIEKAGPYANRVLCLSEGACREELLPDAKIVHAHAHSHPHGGAEHIHCANCEHGDAHGHDAAHCAECAHCDSSCEHGEHAHHEEKEHTHHAHHGKGGEGNA